ncbi:hypothetical protein PC9H_004905 [Pleurotus ostreatus]|uniref:U3 small nucleolar RNA-associated protein 15 C-terminal domain-containing protein n=2 Tax=Pleurotus ostreatus TaxID=5322 RepID=A0A067NZ59_PLEO1|nr:uncharacterized protein PC9H_004905 [Pleurotus ostreatus]KAF7432961.1 hypothetical protein PC9H_004905 [Pleurotus ostreatus]KDQ29437.1 hypothetical protein PLEOSDRAFT_26645 [Pleurotus ostreatus PC15]
MDYQPLVVKAHPRTASKKHSSESRHWRQFKHPVFVKEYAPVTSIHFSPSRPHRYAVTAATRVQIYAPRTQKVTKTISRFKEVVRSASFRNDGKLLAAGDDSGLIQVFDVNSRAILRTLDSHKQPVHVARFSPLEPTQALSCSDDTTVKIWDVSSQTVLNTFTDHSDYVRTGQVSPVSPYVILTGSYDSTVRLYDTRSNVCEMVMGQSEQGSVHNPIEQVLMFPSGTVALSSSGPILRVWDIVAGGRCIRALSNHQKTVTSLAFNANASRLLTGGLDHMVKVYDISTYKVVHTMRYPAPLLCVSISPDETHIAAGMSDGTLSVRRRQLKVSEPSASDLLTSAATLRLVKNKTKPKALGDEDEFRVESKRSKRLKEYDRLLKNFKYSAALDSVLRKQVPPAVTFSLIQELIARDGLRSALSGRDDVLLEPILRYLIKYVADPRFGQTVCDVAAFLIDMYNPVLGQSPLMDTLFLRLQKKVTAEVRFQRTLLQTKGALDMLFASTALSASAGITPSQK